jgi:hypothetical protein
MNKDSNVFSTNGTYPWSCVTHIFHNGQLSQGSDRKKNVQQSVMSVSRCKSNLSDSLSVMVVCVPLQGNISESVSSGRVCPVRK